MASELLNRLNPPDQPGVYLMHDASGKIIYVGKAISLKKRLHSYFRPEEQLDPKTQALMRRLERIEILVTDSELEALVLECNLIKKHRPRYNVIMRDDKSYPYLKVTQEPFPRLLVTRKPFMDDAQYFGPFVRGSLREAVRTLSLHFGLRLCKMDLKPGDALDRACLYAQIGACAAVCRGLESQEQYAERVQNLLAFLQGDKDTLSQELESRMRQAAEEHQFEQAAKWRDVLNDIRVIREKPLLSSTAREDRDILGLARSGNSATVEVFTVRSGNLEGRRHYFLQHAGQDSTADVLAQVVKQYYTQSVGIPPEILVPELPGEAELLVKWLEARRGGSVSLRLPEPGEEQRLLKMAETNAWLFLKHETQSRDDEPDAAQRAVLEDLQKQLNLPGLPLRVECYDISNISGTDAVGSQVVFILGRPELSQYRRYKIKSVQGPNDFAMLQEVLDRRLRRVLSGQSPKPDLLVIDGGAGQLSAVKKVLDELGLADLPVMGLAKKHEEIYQAGRDQPLRLSTGSPALLMLTRLRDEAHRFAVAYHRKLRGKRMQASVLDQVKGLGPAKRRDLLRTFGSVEALLQVAETDLAAIDGIGPVLARRIQTVIRGKI